MAGLDRSQFYADFNASKLVIGLDLTNPAGREVALRLAAWSERALATLRGRKDAEDVLAVHLAAWSAALLRRPGVQLFEDVGPPLRPGR